MTINGGLVNYYQAMIYVDKRQTKALFLLLIINLHDDNVKQILSLKNPPPPS